MSKESHFNTKWRPAMGWLYLTVCLCDFILFPVLWNMAQTIYLNQVVLTQWNPLTLQGAGFFHIAMGAVLGITSYGRSQEKIEDKKVISQSMEQSFLKKQKIKIDDQIG